MGKWEVPGQYFIEMHEENGKGLAIFVKNRYGFDCQGSRLGISLLRAPAFEPPDKSACKWYDPSTLPSRLKIKDQGIHVLDWAIYPFVHDDFKENLYAKAIEYAYIPRFKEIDDSIHNISTNEQNFSVMNGFLIDNSDIFLSVAKFPYDYPTERGIILRLIELQGKKTSFSLRCPGFFEIVDIHQCDLLELKKQRLEEFKVKKSIESDSIEWKSELSPFEISTFYLKFK